VVEGSCAVVGPGDRVPDGALLLDSGAQRHIVRDLTYVVHLRPESSIVVRSIDGEAPPLSVTAVVNIEFGLYDMHGVLRRVGTEALLVPRARVDVLSVPDICANGGFFQAGPSGRAEIELADGSVYPACGSARAFWLQPMLLARASDEAAVLERVC